MLQNVSENNIATKMSIKKNVTCTTKASILVAANTTVIKIK